MSTREQQVPDKQSTAAGILARLWWMLLGNMILAFSLIFIFRQERGFLHPADAVFWIVVATLVLVRYLDIRFLNGQTAMGTPASLKDWTRYVVLVAVGSTIAWALAHTANHLFARTP
jgi:hypothetical protein